MGLFNQNYPIPIDIMGLITAVLGLLPNQACHPIDLAFIAM